MSTYTRQFAEGTYLIYEEGTNRLLGGKALCSDGKVRRLCRTRGYADTFFSIPAAVQVYAKKGKSKKVTLSGFISIETMEGMQTEVDTDPAVVKFTAYTYRENASHLPAGKFVREPALQKFIKATGTLTDAPA